MGFSVEGVQKAEGGYLVEGDIFLPESDLGAQPSSPNMVIANEEQYRTFNLVNPSSYPTIKVRLSNTSSGSPGRFFCCFRQCNSKV